MYLVIEFKKISNYTSLAGSSWHSRLIVMRVVDAWFELLSLDRSERFVSERARFMPCLWFSAALNSSVPVVDMAGDRAEVDIIELALEDRSRSKRASELLLLLLLVVKRSLLPIADK